jgi:hypothetical protein
MKSPSEHAETTDRVILLGGSESARTRSPAAVAVRLLRWLAFVPAGAAAGFVVIFVLGGMMGTRIASHGAPLFSEAEIKAMRGIFGAASFAAVLGAAACAPRRDKGLPAAAMLLALVVWTVGGELYGDDWGLRWPIRFGGLLGFFVVLRAAEVRRAATERTPPA